MQKLHNHVHKFRRKTYSTGNSVYYCIDDCNFKIGVEFSLGKLTRCNHCNKPFQMNEYSIRKAKPKCNDCIKRRTIKKELVNANNVAPIVESSAVNDSPVSAPIDSVSKLKEQLEHLKENPVIIKEYNPDDEEVEL